MIPRPYQEEMISCAVEGLRRKDTVLIQAATGAGKTIVFAELIRRWLNQYQELRILVLVHREIIVKQNADKLRAIWPGAPIGIACASISSKVDMGAPVVFGSVQTLASRLETLPMFHLVIVDEAHRLPPKNQPSQYRAVLERLKAYYPPLRIFGLTATPFRLGWGPIHGKLHKRKSDKEPPANWFEEIDLEVGIKKLQGIQPDDTNPDAPYLCGLRAFVEDKTISLELNQVGKVAGEFNQTELSDLMQKTVHLQTAIDAYRKHCEGRSRAVVFAVDISHAERLKKIFCDAGIRAECVHSENNKSDDRQKMADFEDGKFPVLVNVGVLTEGWDCRAVDLVLLCRPTMSAALFVQIVGRGLRTHPEKNDVLVLDLAGNFNRHGPPWAPILPCYDSPGRPKEVQQMPDKECPACGHQNPPRVWCCESCGEILKVRQVTEAKSVALRELNLDRMTAKPEGKPARLISMDFSKHVTPHGNVCLKVSVYASLSQEKGSLEGNLFGQVGASAMHFYRMDGPGSFYFGKFWKQIAGSLPIPSSVDDAVKARRLIVDLPSSISLLKDGKYWKVSGW